MARETIVQPTPDDENRREHDSALRPRWLREVIGQKAVVRRLGIVLNACRKLKEPMSHILFDGPPGLGKTTFGTVLPNELGASIQMTSGPALAKPADLLPFLTNVEEGSFLFIDEIHRMPRMVEEFIYPAMEDFRIDIVLGEGVNARTISMRLKRFTLIGATTRSGMLSSPMRDRFKMHEHLEFYSVEELAEIVRINSRKLQTVIGDDAALELAKRSRGTPPSPTRACGGRATTPPANPTALSLWTLPAKRSTWRKWTAKVWTNKTAVISKRWSAFSRADQPAWKRLPPP